MHASGLFACLPDSCLYAFIRSPHAALSLARFASGWMTRRLSLRRDLDLVVAVVAATMRSHSLCFRGLFRFFPTSLCGVLVFRLDPAGASSSASSASSASRLLRLRRLLFIFTHHSLTHSLTHSFTHCTDSFLAAFRVARAVHRVSRRSCGARGRRWGRGCLSCSRRSIHRASWTSCGARGRRWGRGCLSRGRRSTLSCGRRSTQSLLDELRRAWPRGRGTAAAFQAGAVHRASCMDELRRAWPPLGPRLPFAWQAQYIALPGRAAARVAAAGAAAAFAWQAQCTVLA